MNRQVPTWSLQSCLLSIQMSKGWLSAHSEDTAGPELPGSGAPRKPAHQYGGEEHMHSRTVGATGFRGLPRVPPLHQGLSGPVEACYGCHGFLLCVQST